MGAIFGACRWEKQCATPLLWLATCLPPWHPPPFYLIFAKIMPANIRKAGTLSAKNAWLKTSTCKGRWFWTFFLPDPGWAHVWNKHIKWENTIKSTLILPPNLLKWTNMKHGSGTATPPRSPFNSRLLPAKQRGGREANVPENKASSEIGELLCRWWNSINEWRWWMRLEQTFNFFFGHWKCRLQGQTKI